MTEFGIFNGVKTAWRCSGSGRDVILLHGWGQNMQMMQKIEEHLQPFFCVYNLDFPGFGQSDDPTAAWAIEDYEKFLEDFIEKNGIQEPIIIAHSFGCRIAILHASEHKVRKMCLTGAAGIREKQGFARKLKTNTFKAGRWILEKTGQEELIEKLKRQNGSEDYRNVSGVMRDTFVKVVNSDVSPVLNKVTCPVLLVFGEYDQAVPLWMGKKMEQEMGDAALVVFENDDHWAYWHQYERFNRVLDAFLKGDKQ